MGTASFRSEPVFVDCGIAPEFFICGIANIERLAGNCFRFTLYTEHTAANGTKERLAVAKFVMPGSEVPRAVRQAMTAVGQAVAGSFAH